jgi:hypothetical protein
MMYTMTTATAAAAAAAMHDRYGLVLLSISMLL